MIRNVSHGRLCVSKEEILRWDKTAPLNRALSIGRTSDWVALAMGPVSRSSSRGIVCRAGTARVCSSVSA